MKSNLRRHNLSQILCIALLVCFGLTIPCLTAAQDQESPKEWFASDLIAEGILQNKQIFFAQEVELPELILVDFFRVLGNSRMRQLNYSRFEIFANLPVTARRTLRPSPRYRTIFANTRTGRNFLIPDSHDEILTGEQKITLEPTFYQDSSKWLLILDELPLDIKADIQKVSSSSTNLNNEQINGLYKEGKAAFKIVAQKSKDASSELTNSEYEELRAIHLTLKTNGFVTDPQIAALKSDFAKELAKKLNAAVKP